MWLLMKMVAIQISKNGLSDDKRKAAYLELFIKLVRITHLQIWYWKMSNQF